MSATDYLASLSVDEALSIRDHLAYNEHEFRPDDSVRGMYGASWNGVVHRPGEQHLAVESLAKSFETENYPDAAEYVRNTPASGDSMGLREITYWPSLCPGDNFDQLEWIEREDD